MYEQRNLGLAYVGLGDRDASAELMQEGFRVLAEVEPGFPNDAEVLSALGLLLLRKQVPEEARLRFEKVTRLRPHDGVSWLNLGVAQYAVRNSAAAITSLEKAISIDPSLSAAYRLLAEIHASAGNAVLAQRALDRYLEFMPQNMELRRKRNPR
jgi:tetratricopeptide (TPR) repeat protein